MGPKIKKKTISLIATTALTAQTFFNNDDNQKFTVPVPHCCNFKKATRSTIN